MKLHQFFEARQMKDPTKDSLVSRNGKVIVIDKEHEEEYLKKGWELAEAYPIYKTKDYLDRQDRNLKKTPKEKPKKITKISDLVKDLSGKSTKLRDFGKGIFKFDESRFRSWLYDTYGKSIEELKGNDYAILSKEFQKQKKVTKVSDLTKDLSGKSTKLRDFGKGIFKFESDREEPESNCCGAPFDFETFDGYDGRCSACGEMAPDANIEPKEALDPKTATKKQIRQADVKGEIGAKYKDMKAGEFAKAHGDQWRKKKPVVHSTKKDKLVSLKVAKEEKYPQSLLLKGDEDAAKKSKAERQKDKDTKLKLAKKETDYSMPRSKREKEQAKNSATNEFTPDHIHYATMKRVKAYDKTRKTEEGVIDQLEPEWSEGKRRLGNEIRAKLGMKQLPELDWKKDMEMKHARTALKARFAEGEERSDVQALMREKCEEWLANVQPGSYLGYEDLESDMYDYARGLTHDDLGSGDDLRNFMDNPGDEAGQVVQDVLASNHRVEIEDLFAEGVESPSKEEIMKVLPHLHDEYVKTGRYNAFELSNILKQMYPELGRREASNYVADFFKTFKEGVISNPESYSKEENQVSAILGKALGKSPDEALRYAPGELFSELESVNPELADSIASISSIVYNVKLEEKYDGYYLAQRAADLWHKDNPNKRRDGYFRVGVDVQDEYAEKAGGKKGKYRGHGASEWTTEEKVGEKLRKSTLPKITQADKDDAVDFLGSIKRTDPNAYKRLIKRLKD